MILTLADFDTIVYIATRRLRSVEDAGSHGGLPVR